MCDFEAERDISVPGQTTVPHVIARSVKSLPMAVWVYTVVGYAPLHCVSAVYTEN